MNIDRIVVAVVGLAIMAGTGIFYITQEPLWLIVPAFIGFMLFQAAFTKFCPMASILKMMGARPGPVFN